MKNAKTSAAATIQTEDVLGQIKKLLGTGLGGDLIVRFDYVFGGYQLILNNGKKGKVIPGPTFLEALLAMRCHLIRELRLSVTRSEEAQKRRKAVLDEALEDDDGFE